MFEVTLLIHKFMALQENKWINILNFVIPAYAGI